MAAPMDRMDVGKFVRILSKSKAGSKTIEPYARSGHCCATDGINLFVFGGYHPEYCRIEPEGSDRKVITRHKVFKEMWCFNLATETWREVSTVGDTPAETASMSMLLSGHTLLFYGGTTYPWGQTSNADVIVFKLKDRMWTTLTCRGQCPPGKYGQAMTLIQGHLYVFGGCRRLTEEDYQFDADLHCLDLATQSWSLLSDTDEQDDEEAAARVMYRHSLAWHGSKMYLVGSSWKEMLSSAVHSKIHVYDVDTKSWSLENTLRSCDGYPPRRQYHSCVQWQNEVYICGGHNRQLVLGDIWKLELPSLQWTQLPAELPIPSFFHSAAITPSKCMYIFGGVTCLQDRHRTNHIFRIWLATPSLVDLALQRVLSLLPDRGDDSIARLRDLGIPKNIMERLRHV